MELWQCKAAAEFALIVVWAVNVWCSSKIHLNHSYTSYNRLMACIVVNDERYYKQCL